MRLPLTRLRSFHLLIAAAIVLLALAMAVTFRTSSPERASEVRNIETTKDRAVSAMPKALGRRHCEHKCAAVRKGYIYRAEQELQGVRGPYLEPEVCTCF
jgi:hypothetical protein